MREEIVKVGLAAESSRTSVEDAGTAIVPLLGLVVNLDNPSEVAKALAAVRQAKLTLDQARGDLERILIDESERQGTKTLHLDGLDAVISGGPTVVWDVEKLREDLSDLGLPEDRLNALITARVEYKVNASVAKQLSSANESYAGAVESAKTWVEKPFRVDVK